MDLMSKLGCRQPVIAQLSVILKSQCWSAVRCNVLLGRSFRNKSSKDMALPHPQPRKGNYRSSHIPNNGGVVWKLFKRTIDVTDYRNGKDNVYPAKNRTFGGIANHLIPFH